MSVNNSNKHYQTERKNKDNNEHKRNTQNR